MFVLKNSADQRLIGCTLKTLYKFLAIGWIPHHIVFSSQLIEALTLKYFSIPSHRVSTLRCLVEIAGIRQLSQSEHSEKLINMFLTVLRKTFSDCSLAMNTNLDVYVNENEAHFEFILLLTNFLFNFLRYHHEKLEQHNNGSREGLKAALKLLLNVSNVRNQTLFQICCDLWEYLVRDLEKCLKPKTMMVKNSNHLNSADPKYQLYAQAMHELKTILMRKLPRPREVLVVKDDNNNVIKQEMKDTFMLTLHRQMSKILYILSSIDPSDTRSVIGEKLNYFQSNKTQNNKQNEDDFFNELNSLCWSIGAVAGSMPPDVEKSFLVVVIKILLGLCEVQQSKNAKAIIASCIMYVVRKYPRFLKKHWKFLQTVVRKLIEFLAEKHPGVQDMSIETLNEICTKCGHKFLKIQENDSQIFLDELVDGMDAMCNKLTREQIENLYVTWSVIISHNKRNIEQSQQQIGQLLATPNQRYQQLLAANVYSDEASINKFIHLLRIYKGVCQNCGGRSNGSFFVQFSNLYKTLISLYSGYAQLMNSWYTNPENAKLSRSAAPTMIRLMSTLKHEILSLFLVFVTKGALKRDYDRIATQFVPDFLDAILTDYTNCSNLYKEYECLNVCSALIETLDVLMNSFIPKIFATLFQSTLDMIKESMDNYPDHRLAFFKFLYNVNKCCFAVFEQMNATQMQLVINCIMWAHEHIDHQICEYGTKTLNQFLQHIRNRSEQTQNGALITMFYRNFLFLILEKLLCVMTDTLHKSSFGAMCYTLKSIASDINNSQYLGNLSDNQQTNNQQFVAQKLSNFIQAKFCHLTRSVIQKFVIGLFELANSEETLASKSESKPYLQHCEDFLVAIRSIHHQNDNNNKTSEQTQSNNVGGGGGGGTAPTTTNGHIANDEFNDDDL